MAAATMPSEHATIEVRRSKRSAMGATSAEAAKGPNIDTPTYSNVSDKLKPLLTRKAAVNRGKDTVAQGVRNETATARAARRERCLERSLDCSRVSSHFFDSGK